MLDIEAGKPPAPPPNISVVQFYDVKLTPLADGQLFVLLAATRVDEASLEFLLEQMAAEKVATIDDAFGLIAEHMRSGP